MGITEIKRLSTNDDFVAKIRDQFKYYFLKLKAL